MSLWQALFLGFLQGATELFPVSSLGHAVLLPRLLGWSFNQSDPSFVPYIVLLHLGTAGALLVVFWEDWVRIVRAFFRAVYKGRVGDDPNERLAMLIFVGTIPAGLLGAFFESDLKKLFATPRVAAAFLVVNAAIMGTGELLRRRAERRRLQTSSGTEEGFATESDLGFLPAVARRKIPTICAWPTLTGPLNMMTIWVTRCFLLATSATLIIVTSGSGATFSVP